MSAVYILGGDQTDFAEPWSRRGLGLFEMMESAVRGALSNTELAPEDVDASHVANFVGELFAGQGHLGGFFAAIDPGFEGKPSSRHEAACASGSIAVLAAQAEILAGLHDCVVVVGVEQMRNVKGDVAAKHLAAAAWVGKEAEEATYCWPYMFSKLADEYEARYGLDARHLARIGEINLLNAKRNPRSQTRGWGFNEKSFTPDEKENPIIEGRIRKHDCSQVTDGACAVVLASERFARAWAEKRGKKLEDLSVIRGFGHRTSTMLYSEKIAKSRGERHVFPQVRGTIEDAFRRAGIPDVSGVDLIETHDCFTPTEYMAIDHFGITAPGEAWKAVEDGRIELGGSIPINPSGGLIGCGHPVGATGIRMLLDGHRQVTGAAGDYQVEGARTAATLNIGGSATTIVSFVVGRAG
ncbi:MAG: acetyl-CoA acetyltransferase [Polyangiales bacterium]